MTIDLRGRLAGQASVEVAITGRNQGQLVRTTLGTNLDLGFRAPECPTSAGELDGKDGLRLSITTELLGADKSVDYYYTYVVFQDTQLHGVTGIDAKLKTLRITDKLQTGEYTGGSIWGGTRIESEARRQTVVNMKTGQYDPGRSNVQVSVALSGILRIFQSSALAGATQRLQKAADEGFAATVKRAIDKYREREKGWQRPNKCAQLTFSPRKNTLTLKGGDRGSFTATARAKSDGKRTALDARLSQMQFAFFSPRRVVGERARFRYARVASGAPPGSKVSARVRATSKAGVASDTWEQPLGPQFEINQIAGNFSGAFTRQYSIGTAHVSWTASGAFERQTPPGVAWAFGTYVLKAGVATFHYSGQTLTEHADCDMRGSATVDLFQQGSGSINVSPVNGMRLFEKGPHTYGGDAGVGPDPRVTLTMENCGPGAESENGKQYEYPLGFPPLKTGPNAQQSPDGLEYTGSYSESGSGTTTEWSWALTGSKKSP